MIEDANQIIEAASARGWDLYPGKMGDTTLTSTAMRSLGPAKGTLSEGTRYVLWPKGYAFGDCEKLEPVVAEHGLLPHPQITVPQSTRPVGEVVYAFGPNGEDQYPDILMPGQQVPMIGFTVQGEEVELISPSKARMQLDAFVEALESLPDITGRLAMAG